MPTPDRDSETASEGPATPAAEAPLPEPIHVQFARARRRAMTGASVGAVLLLASALCRSGVLLGLAIPCIVIAIRSWRCPACRMFIEDLESPHCTRCRALLRSR